MPVPGHILYLGATLPSLSETFVTRELLALRGRGVPIAVASVHPPKPGLGDPALDALAREAVPVYGGGAAGLLADAARFALIHPWRATRMGLRALADAALAPDVRVQGRPKVLWQCLGAMALCHRVRSRAIAHIHAHMAHVPATIAMYAAIGLHVPFSFTGHAADLFRDRSLLAAKLRRAAFVACISEWHRGFYRRSVPIPDQRLPVVRCGVDLPASTISSRAGAPPTIACVARLVPKKGIDVLLGACAELRRRGVCFRVQIAGDGPQLAALTRQSADLGLSDSVQFLGAVPNHDARRLIAAADLFVLPCRIDADGDRDGIPVVLMEAMAAGVCVVSGDLPTIRELVRDGVSGLLVPSDNPEALVSAMQGLLENPARRAALAAAGRARIAEEFELNLNIARLQRAFEHALGRPLAPAIGAPETRQVIAAT